MQFIWLFIGCLGSLFASDLQTYFKKISDKSDNHSMQNIDFIYMINLDQRPEKFASAKAELAPYGIIPYRFSAVNGWELSLDTLDHVGVKYSIGMSYGKWGTCYLLKDGKEAVEHEIVQTPGKTYFSHCMSRGAIGIVLSHLSILQDAYDSGYETIWVMEDDVEVIQDPRVLPDLIDRLDNLVGKSAWDILFTDRDTKNNNGENVPCAAYAWRPNFAPQRPMRFTERRNIGTEFRYIGSRYGAYSMIVRRSGMKKILDFFKNYAIFLPFDMEFTLPNDIHLVTVQNDVVSTQIRALSDNGAPNYKNNLCVPIEN
jgi:GR25 family glycosyltransferase involved in LPS biosynthesis